MNTSNKQGFTLIEVIVSIIILSVFFSVILHLFSLSVHNEMRNNKRFEKLIQFNNYIVSGYSSLDPEKQKDYKQQQHSSFRYGKHINYFLDKDKKANVFQLEVFQAHS